MGGGEPVGDASKQMHDHDVFDDWFEMNCTYVGEGSEDGSDFQTKDLANQFRLGLLL